jgi:hypothetical protein
MNDSTKKDLHRKVKEALSYSLFWDLYENTTKR